LTPALSIGQFSSLFVFLFEKSARVGQVAGSLAFQLSQTTETKREVRGCFAERRESRGGPNFFSLEVSFLCSSKKREKGGDGTEWESHVTALSVETPPLFTDD
jgi:hypothetical protein